MSKKKSARKLKMPSWRARKERGFTYFYYRTRIFLVSLGLAVITTGFIPRGLGIWGIELMSFLGSFMSFVVLGDALVYRALKCKESERISPEKLFKWDQMSADQLDGFIQKAARLRMRTFFVGLMGLVLTGFSIKFLPFLILLVFGLRIFGVVCTIRKKQIRIPASYIVFLCGLKNARPYLQGMSKIHHPEILTMDNAFYAGTGVITYRKL